LANNVNFGKAYVVSNWGESPAKHLKTIIATATIGLQALVRLTIDTTKILISSILTKIDQTLKI
tara:strand:+ start:194 stop:385 length:192 start_codon:yes stop_codon:yes gene_type:complete